MNKMYFQCKELWISDEEFGCTITFSDSKTSEDRSKNAEEIWNSNEKYLLIQRTYPEDDFEPDYYHLESSEFETGPDSNDIVTVRMDPKRFRISWKGVILVIGLDLTKKEIKNLKNVLESRFKNRIKI